MWCWGLNCCHSTQLNHLVCNGGFTLYPLLWGMGARPVYGSFQLTGLGVCLLCCQVRLERSSEGFALRHSHPIFYRKIPLFYNPSLLFVVFPIMPISDNILLTDVTFLHRVIARNSFTIQHCLLWWSRGSRPQLKLTTYLEVKVQRYYVYGGTPVRYHGNL